MSWSGYVNFTKVVLRGCNRPLTDTAAILNKSDSRSIMGFAGGKTNLAWQAWRTSFFFFFFYFRAFCSFICLVMADRDLVSKVYHARSIFFRLLSPPRFSNIPLSGCLQQKLLHHCFYLGGLPSFVTSLLCYLWCHILIEEDLPFPLILCANGGKC